MYSKLVMSELSETTRRWIYKKKKIANHHCKTDRSDFTQNPKIFLVIIRIILLSVRDMVNNMLSDVYFKKIRFHRNLCDIYLVQARMVILSQPLNGSILISILMSSTCDFT